MGKLTKKDKAKLLRNACLHCVFFKAHHDKWPKWKPEDDKDGSEAFNDLVHNAIKIVSEIFTMLDESARMRFYENVNSQVGKRETLEAMMEGKPTSLKELLEKLGVVTKPDEPVKH